MSVVIKQKVETVATISSANTTFVTTADILVGEDIFIAMGRTSLSTTTVGMSNITTSAGAGTFEYVATSCRASAYDIALGRFRVTTLIPSGSTITCIANSPCTKRGGVMQVVAGLSSSAANASSGTAANGNAGNVSGGSHGSSTSLSSSTASTTSVADCLVLGAMSSGGSLANTITSTGGATTLGEARTTSGTADRGVLLQYEIVSIAEVQTATATQVTNGSWAATVGAFEIETAPPSPSSLEFKEWNGSSWVALTPKEWNGSSWVEVTPNETT